MHSGRACYDHFRATLWRERLARRQSRRRPRDLLHRNVLRVDLQRRLQADSLASASHTTAEQPADLVTHTCHHVAIVAGPPVRRAAARLRFATGMARTNSARRRSSQLRIWRPLGFTRSRRKQTHTHVDDRPAHSHTGGLARRGSPCPRACRSWQRVCSLRPELRAHTHAFAAGTARSRTHCIGFGCHRVNHAPSRPRGPAAWRVTAARDVKRRCDPSRRCGSRGLDHHPARAAPYDGCAR